MTGGRIDGSYLPAVGSWQRAHPGYTYTPDPWERDHDHDRSLAAAVEASVTDTRDLAHHDAS
jgi:hypothetical protein